MDGFQKINKNISLCHFQVILDLDKNKALLQREIQNIYFGTSERKPAIGASWYSQLKFLSFLCKVRQAATNIVYAAFQWLQLSKAEVMFFNQIQDWIKMKLNLWQF